MPITNGYSLSLSDGSKWWISAEEDCSSLVGKLARIMRLKKSKLNGSAQLIFSETLGRNDDREGNDKGNNDLEYISPSISEQDWTYYSGRDYFCIWNHKEKPIHLFEARFPDDEYLGYVSLSYSLMPIFQQSISMGGIVLHASSAELDGKAILFAAPGGTGKSTCYRRLPDYWKRLSDDENLVVLGEDGRYRVHPLPTWSEYFRREAENTWDVQYSVPFSAVFFLEQADVDEVTPMGKGRAAFTLSRSARESSRLLQLVVDREGQLDCRRKLFMNCCKVADSIQAFRLRATLDGKFWEEVEKVIK